jgi:hypothetical protein
MCECQWVRKVNRVVARFGMRDDSELGVVERRLRFLGARMWIVIGVIDELGVVERRLRFRSEGVWTWIVIGVINRLQHTQCTVHDY